MVNQILFTFYDAYLDFLRPRKFTENGNSQLNMSMYCTYYWQYYRYLESKCTCYPILERLTFYRKYSTYRTFWCNLSLKTFRRTNEEIQNLLYKGNKT